jgi:pimeloyl-ACP methyl ester carboxylesterase
MSSGALAQLAHALEAGPDLSSTSTASATCPRSLPDYVERVDRAFVSLELEDVRCLSVATSDGGLTTLYEYGTEAGESIVLLPPYGMTFILVARLARLLAKRHHVVIWESKGSPDASATVSDADFGLSSQAARFARIIEARRLHEVHFVGWCQAAQIASYAVSHGLVRAKSMSWIAPAGFGYSLLPSEFDRCALPVYLEIERQGLDYAEKFRRVLDKHALAPATEAIVAEKLTMLHLADAQATHVFSRYMRAYEENKAVAKNTLPAAVDSVPTLAMHSRDDTFSHFSESVQIAKKHPSVRLQLLESGGHLQVFNSPTAIVAHILGFIDLVGKNVDAPGAEGSASQLS